MNVRVWMVLLAVVAAGGCACQHPKNTPLLTALDKAVQPETTGKQIAYGVVWVPAGLACGALDVCVIHPVQSLGLSARDMWRTVWADPKGSFAQQVFLFVPKVVATPVVFSMGWVAHSLFDIRPREED